MRKMTCEVYLSTDFDLELELELEFEFEFEPEFEHGGAMSTPPLPLPIEVMPTLPSLWSPKSTPSPPLRAKVERTRLTEDWPATD